jgi:DNA-binding winged helix-turn-helix (wHTH) protein
MTEGPVSSAKIDLAREADFVLGGLRISPSAGRVASGGSEERVEPRVMEVLIVLARDAGQTISREQLIAACWGGRAVSDDAVTRVIARVRALGRRSEPPHFSLETLPKVGFRLIVEAPAVEAEVGVSGGEAAREQSADPKSRWRTLSIAAAAIAVAVLTFIAVSAVEPTGSQRVAEARRVVVSPINVMQTHVELHRLAGLTTTALVRSLSGGGIQTSISTSASAPRRDVDHRDVMLAGSADFDGGAYHINVTVSGHESGRVLWSGSFERPAAHLRGLDVEVAHDVAAILQCAFDERRSGIADMRPELLYHFMNTCEGMLGWRSGKALEATQKLVAVAPESADAHAFRSIALDRRAADLDYLSQEAKDLQREAYTEAQKALELDANAAAAHVALARAMDAQADFAKSEYHFLRALKSDAGNIPALIDYGKLLRQVGRVGAARETFGRVHNRPSQLIQDAFLQAMNGNAVEAERRLERLAVIRPSWERGARFTIAAFWTEPSVALARVHQFRESEGVRDVSCIEAHLKRLSESDNQRRGLPEGCGKFDTDWKIRMLARQGDIDGSYELMKQLPNSRWYFAFLFYPEMKAFRHDERFMPLADSLGLVRYWRDTNEWPDFCTERDLPYDCRAWSKAAPP